MSDVSNSSAFARGFIWVFTMARSVFGAMFVVVYTVVMSLPVMLMGALGWHPVATVFMRGWAVLLLAIFGIRAEIEGSEHLPVAGGGIITFNHQSHFDIPILMVSGIRFSHLIRFGAKIELFSIPFFGVAMRAVGCLPIVRENRAEVMRIYKDAEWRFKQNFLFCLAPEGTRQNEPRLGRFKKGPFIFAINAQVPIIPAVIKGTHAVMPKHSLRVNVGRLSRTLHLRYLAPVSTAGLNIHDVDQLVEKVREAMVNAYAELPN